LVEYSQAELIVVLTLITCLISHPLSSIIHLLEVSAELYPVVTYNSLCIYPALVMSFRSWVTQPLGSNPPIHILNNDSLLNIFLGIGRGNPGVFQGYPDPNPPKPIPILRVWVFAG
jgi:hypothetical protein